MALFDSRLLVFWGLGGVQQEPYGERDKVHVRPQGLTNRAGTVSLVRFLSGRLRSHSAL